MQRFLSKIAMSEQPLQRFRRVEGFVHIIITFRAKTENRLSLYYAIVVCIVYDQTARIGKHFGYFRKKGTFKTFYPLSCTKVGKSKHFDYLVEMNKRLTLDTLDAAS